MKHHEVDKDSPPNSPLSRPTVTSLSGSPKDRLSTNDGASHSALPSGVDQLLKPLKTVDLVGRG